MGKRDDLETIRKMISHTKKKSLFKEILGQKFIKCR